MSLPTISEIKLLNPEDLENEILNTRKQLFKFQLYRKTKQNFKSHQFKHGKHRLAQLLMVQNNQKKSTIKVKEQ